MSAWRSREGGGEPVALRGTRLDKRNRCRKKVSQTCVQVRTSRPHSGVARCDNPLRNTAPSRHLLANRRTLLRGQRCVCRREHLTILNSDVPPVQLR